MDGREERVVIWLGEGWMTDPLLPEGWSELAWWVEGTTGVLASSSTTLYSSL